MAKKYTVEIDAEVKNEKDVKQLAEHFEKIDKNAESASKKIEGANKAIDDNSRAKERNIKASEELDKRENFFAKVIGWGTAAIVKWTAWYYIRKKLIASMIPLLTELAVVAGVVTTAIVLMVKAFKSVDTYIQTNERAMIKLQRTMMDETAWKIFKRNIELYVGEALYGLSAKWKEFWTNFKLGFLFVNGGVFGRNAVMSAIAYQLELEKINETLKVFEFRQADIQRQADLFMRKYEDETNTIQEREKAIQGWGIQQQNLYKEQIEILKKRINLEQNALDEGRVEKDQVEAKKEQLKAWRLELKKAGWALEDVNYQVDKYVKSLYTKDLKEQKRELQEITALQKYQYTTFENMLNLLGQKIGTKNKLNQDSEELFRAIGLPEPKAVDERQAYILGKQKEFYDSLEGFQNDYMFDYTASMLQLTKMIKDFAEADIKWTDISWRAKLDIVAAGSQTMLTIAGQLVNALADSASDDFEKQKKYQIAGATIQTLQGMIGAFMGGVNTIPGPAGLILGAVLAAATAVMGFRNIAKIKKTKPESGSGGFSGSSSEVPITAPSFTMINPLTKGESKLNETLNQHNNKPINAYVVSGSVSSQQALDRKIQQQATI